MTPDANRTIAFSGFQWAVKQSVSPVGPGPNVFSAGNVAVDARGLHLSVERRRGEWTCAEVVAQGQFGYGRYSWTVAGDVTSVVTNGVLGMFTWSDQTTHAHRELDIEFARWSAPGPPGNFTVQAAVPPYTHRFDLAAAQRSVHTIDWQPGRVGFSSLAAGRTATWRYTGSFVPVPGGGVTPRMNLWLFRGRAPDAPWRVTFEGFRYTPSTPGAAGSPAPGS